ncbi:hypothetical protein D3C87_2020510 [compost metagenome]
MDAFGAFMNRVEAVVAVVLFQRVLAGITGAAEYLDTDVRSDEAIAGRVGLDHRCE